MKYSIIVLLLGLVLVCGVLTSLEAKTGGSTHGTKWTEYTDPYGRYTIEYPSKWSIQSDPVHIETSTLLEVPFKVSNELGSTLMVEEGVKNELGLSLRELTSLIKNSQNPGLPEKVPLALSCGTSSQSGVEICSYGSIVTFGLNEIGQRVVVYSGSDKRVFVVTFMFRPEESLSGDNINYMIRSLTLTHQPKINEATEVTDITFKIPDFYESPALGIKIWYPHDWQVIDTTGLSFISRVENRQDSFREAVNVSVSPSQGKPLAEIINGIVDSRKHTFTDFDLIKSDSDITLANNSAQRLSYSFSDKEGRMKAMDFAVIKGENYYIIQYIARENQFELYMPLVQKMVDSFEIR